MGFDRKELGLNMNVVKTKDALAKYAGGISRFPPSFKKPLPSKPVII